MKTMFKYASLLFVGGSLLVTSCGKKSDDETVTPVEEKPSTGVSVCQSDKKTTYVLVDASTKAGAADYSKSYLCSVSKTQGTDTIYLDIKAKSNMSYIYITKSIDGLAASPYVGSGNLKTDNGKTVEVGDVSTYSYKLTSSVDAFKLKIPVEVRNSASATSSDVYNIWMTTGTGSFTQTGKKTIVGPLRVSLVYGSVTPYISASGITMGDQLASQASYLSTDGVISTIKGDSLYAGEFSADEKIVAMNCADINLVSLNSDGIAYGKTCGTKTGAKPYFIGVGLRKDLGTCLSNTEGTDKTKFAVYSGTTTFDNLTGDNIAALSTPTLDKVEVTEGGVYVFLTADGRLGVIKATNVATSMNFIADVAVKVLASAKQYRPNIP